MRAKPHTKPAHWTSMPIISHSGSCYWTSMLIINHSYSCYWTSTPLLIGHSESYYWTSMPLWPLGEPWSNVSRNQMSHLGIPHFNQTRNCTAAGSTQQIRCGAVDALLAQLLWQPPFDTYAVLASLALHLTRQGIAGSTARLEMLQPFRIQAHLECFCTG